MKRVRTLAMLMLCACAGLAHALTVAQLQALLQAASRPDARYAETRESPWLSAPAAAGSCPIC